MMTDKLQAKIREMRSKHREVGFHDSACNLDGCRWPCDAARALDALEIAVEQLRKLCRPGAAGILYPARQEADEALAAVEEALGK